MIHPILAKGFRPFFLCAAAYAVLVIPLWLAALTGDFRPGGALPAMYWHGHEMLFGFTMAVVGGFLLTAVSNWTKQVTAVGLPLLLLVGLWLSGRVGMLLGDVLPQQVIAVLDLAFIPALAVAIGRPLIATGNKRNYAFLPIMGMLFLANLACHLDALGITPGIAGRALTVAVDFIMVIIAVITGRIVPMFTRNGLRIEGPRSLPALDKATAIGLAVLGVLDAAAITAVSPIVAGITAVLALVRMRHWGTSKTASRPLIWVLHVGTAWLPIGLMLRAIGPSVGLSATAATHAFTAGAIGTLTLGMMVRVATGHTGRTLVASTPSAIAFTLVTLGAILRVVTAAIGGTAAIHGALGAGVVWALGFAIYLVTFTPILLAPRPDGKPG